MRKMRFSRILSLFFVSLLLLSSIVQVQPSLFTGIDVYTETERFGGYQTPFTGLGLNESADAYAPDEEVTLYAIVTYSGWPFSGRLVAFEVYDAEGNLFLLKTNITDENGITYIKFIIPFPSNTFGTWKVFSKVYMSDKLYNDTLWFNVGWIVELQEVIPYGYREGQWKPVSNFTIVKEHMGFLVKLKNIALTPRNVTIGISVYDDDDVAISLITLAKVRVPEGQFDDPRHFQVFALSLEIPKWAYPGTGTVYASAFTKPPWEVGIPYCPGISASFAIYPLDTMSLNQSSSDSFLYASSNLSISVATDKQSYSLKENVHVYANLTLDGSPVQNELMALAVYNPSKAILFRTMQAGTPPAGNVTIVAVHPSDQFGNHKDSFKIDTSAYFNVTVKNNDVVPKNVTTSLTAYDGNNTPFGTAQTAITLLPNTTFSFISPVPIPNWAYIGTGTVYAGVSTNYSSSGVPYSPEKSASFEITMDALAAAELQASSLQTGIKGAYNSTFKLSPEPEPGNYTVHVSASHQGEQAVNRTTFEVIDVPSPPKASFTYWPFSPLINETVTLDATASSAEGYNDYIVSYAWDFGDGTPIITETDPITNHTFTAIGNYTTTLNVTDTQGLWNTASKTITVSPIPPYGPTADFVYSPYPLKNEAVTFNASISKPGWNGTHETPIVSYEWHFGDGNITMVTNPIIDHTYGAEATYNVTLNVTDSQGFTNTTSKMITVLAPYGPTAIFTYVPSTPFVNETTIFNATLSEPGWKGVTMPITSYTWDFGDGNITTVIDPIIHHAYTDNDTYIVSLNVTDSQGLSDDTSKTITVLPLLPLCGPTAYFVYNPATPLVNQSVTFDASTSRPGSNGTHIMPIVSYAWDFGDGSPITTKPDPVITHNYTAVGNYSVTLNVTDSQGLWNTTTETITILLEGWGRADWVKTAVFYQIYPDRFRDGNPSNNAWGDGSTWGDVLWEAYDSNPTVYAANRTWGEYPYLDPPWGRDWFGGDLQGVEEKVSYLADLGITAIWFNPTMDSTDNHGYTVIDYKSVNRYFGINHRDANGTLILDYNASIEVFKNMTAALAEYGINVVLDGVFNHASAKNQWFDRDDDFPTDGAYESQSSPWYSWFNFYNWPNSYETFGGVKNMPALQEVDGFKDYIYRASDSVVKFWNDLGVDGWRLDVGQGLSHEFWQEFRTYYKQLNPEGFILGEYWGDARDWLQGDEWDSVMNYPFRDAILGWANGGGVTAFDNSLGNIRSWYPEEVFYTLFNILDSHDVTRALSVLGENKTRMKLAVIFQMTYPGVPVIYYGDEVGMSGPGWFEHARQCYPWPDTGGSPDIDMFNHYKTLVAMRKSHPVLSVGSLETRLVDDTKKIYVLVREYNSSVAILVYNNGDTSQTVTVDVSDLMVDGSILTDILNNETYTVSNGNVTVQTNGMWANILLSGVSAPYGPTANFTFSPISPFMFDIVTFDATGSLPGWNGTHEMPITSYTWDFGDGNITTVIDPIIHHAYTDNGTYIVSLNVTVSQGLWNTTIETITVLLPYIPTVSVIFLNGTNSSIYEYTICEEFTVNITVTNVADLWGAEIGLSWNPAVLEVNMSGPHNGFQFSEVWGTHFVDYLSVVGVINNTAGNLENYGALRFFSSLNGNVTLAYIDFHVKGYGNSTLHLTVTLIDSEDREISFVAVDGYIETPLPVHNIDSGLNYATIQRAINAPETLDGHTIFVYAGTYYEHIIVNKSISLIGESKENTVIDGSGTATVVLVTANNTVFQNFTVVNSGQSWPDSGIRLYSSFNSSILDNKVINNYIGIILDYSSNCILKNNDILNNTHNFGVSGESLQQVTHDIDVSNTINGKPVYYLMNQESLTVNPSLYPKVGYLALINSTNITVEDLMLTDNLEGVLLGYTINSTVQNVTTIGNRVGIYLDNSSNNIIQGNNITNNDIGIWIVEEGRSHNKFYHNNFINNTQQVYVETSDANFWDNGAEGNHWSDYNGIDSDGDGIGDAPYVINENNTDNFPLMEPWTLFRTFNVTSDGETYQVTTSSNSTIASFNYNQTLNQFSFNATGPSGTTGFCDLIVPKDLGNDTFIVLVDGDPVEYVQTENATHYFLSFSYTHSTSQIQITTGILTHPSTLSIYEIKLNLDLTLNQGTNLTIKFYSYSGEFQAEYTVWSGTTPHHIEISTQIQHPHGLPIEIATLVLTNEAGEVISTLTTFTMHRHHLMSRLVELDSAWLYASPAERSAIFSEIISIDMQWPYAPP